MTDFYSQNRCVCSTRSHGPLLCAFCLSFHFKCSPNLTRHSSSLSGSQLLLVQPVQSYVCTSQCTPIQVTTLKKYFNCYYNNVPGV